MHTRRERNKHQVLNNMSSPYGIPDGMVFIVYNIIGMADSNLFVECTRVECTIVHTQHNTTAYVRCARMLPGST